MRSATCTSHKDDEDRTVERAVSCRISCAFRTISQECREAHKEDGIASSFAAQAGRTPRNDPGNPFAP